MEYSHQYSMCLKIQNIWQMHLVLDWYWSLSSSTQRGQPFYSFHALLKVAEFWKTHFTVDIWSALKWPRLAQNALMLLLSSVFHSSVSSQYDITWIFQKVFCSEECFFQGQIKSNHIECTAGLICWHHSAEAEQTNFWLLETSAFKLFTRQFSRFLCIIIENTISCMMLHLHYPGHS